MGNPFVSRQRAWPSKHSAGARTARARLRASVCRRLLSVGDEQAGDTLIEVMIAALLLAVIVIATLNGINATSRAAALGRNRAQATALAEQDQERMRGLSIPALREILEKGEPLRERKLEGTSFWIASSVEYVHSGSGTSACTTSETLEASYYEIKSTVTWAQMGKNAPAVQTSVIAPPAGASLVVQVENAEGKGTSGMVSEVEGPLSAVSLTTGITSAAGCAIFSFKQGGEYLVNVHQTGYVDQNWYASSKEDPKSIKNVDLTVGLTGKAPYQFDLAGAIDPRLFTAPATLLDGLEQRLGAPARNVVAASSGITLNPPYRRLLEPKNATAPEESIESGYRVFPFHTEYTLFAGSCLANKPELHAQTATRASVARGSSVTPEIALPALIVRVLKGTQASEEEREKKGEPPQYAGEKPTEEEAPKVVLVNTNTGIGSEPEECDTERYEPQTLPWEGEPAPEHWVVETPTKITDEYPRGSGKIVTTITPHGETERGVLRFPGQPYGTYNVCVLNPLHAADPTEQPMYIFKSEVVNANPGVSAEGHDGTWVTLYEGYSAIKEPAPEALHQSEGGECPTS